MPSNELKEIERKAAAAEAELTEAMEVQATVLAAAQRHAKELEQATRAVEDNVEILELLRFRRLKARSEQAGAVKALSIAQAEVDAATEAERNATSAAMVARGQLGNAMQVATQADQAAKKAKADADRAQARADEAEQRWERVVQKHGGDVDEALLTGTEKRTRTALAKAKEAAEAARAQAERKPDAEEQARTADLFEQTAADADARAAQAQARTAGAERDRNEADETAIKIHRELEALTSQIIDREKGAEAAKAWYREAEQRAAAAAEQVADADRRVEEARARASKVAVALPAVHEAVSGERIKVRAILPREDPDNYDFHWDTGQIPVIGEETGPVVLLDASRLTPGEYLVSVTATRK